MTKTPSSPSEALERLTRGATRVVSPEALDAKLREGRPLRIKLGVDPTAAEIHLGHAVVLTRLRAFQDLGHRVTFIIGDFTAAIGDPSGRDATRPPLSAEEIEANTRSYTEQVFKILDPARTDVRRNSEWLYPLFDRKHPAFLMKTLLRRHTVQQLMERDDFTERRKAGEPITVLELLYPLFQGYDSVAVEADVELGGNDQLFNLLMGRELQKDVGQPPQVVMTFPLLEGLDGTRKMSKSYGNHVGLNDPPDEMFGKIMSVPDELMWSYYTLLTDDDVAVARALHPKEAKERLALSLTCRFHGDAAARAARETFAALFTRKETPDQMPEVVLSGETAAVEVLVQAGLAPSKNEARRLLEQGGVELDGERLGPASRVRVGAPAVLKAGKRRFCRLMPG